MMGYDKISLNEDILLDLPFSEGVGVITHDQAKPHHILTQNVPGGGSFTWDNLVSNYPILEFASVGGGPTDGVYLDCPAADTADLDFTAGDYSIGCWLNWTSGDDSQIIVGRYHVSNDGWELYLYEDGAVRRLTLRHHHAGGAALRTATYSEDWTQDVWCLLGISRSGVNGLHYRNGVAVAVLGDALEDPELCGNDLVIGARYTKDANWYEGKQSHVRLWDRALSAAEWMQIFETERDRYGV